MASTIAKLMCSNLDEANRFDDRQMIRVAMTV